MGELYAFNYVNMIWSRCFKSEIWPARCNRSTTYLICTRDREIGAVSLGRKSFIFPNCPVTMIWVINGIRDSDSRVCIAKLRVPTFSRLERQFARACDFFIG